MIAFTFFHHVVLGLGYFCLFCILFNAFLYMVQVHLSLCKSSLKVVGFSFDDGAKLLPYIHIACFFFLNFHWLVEMTLKRLLEQQGESSNLE